MSPAPRMPAAERRTSIIAAATGLFAKQGFVATTTAQIARECKVAEPILYRHFPNKKDLYATCVESAWEQLRARLEKAAAKETDPARISSAVNQAGIESLHKERYGRLWIGALTEPGVDPATRKVAQKNLLELHGFVQHALEQAAAAGGNGAGHDFHAEAWINLSIGVTIAAMRSTGLPAKADLDGILAARRNWLSRDV